MAQNSDPSDLDFPQVIKQVAEKSNDALRVIDITKTVPVPFDAITAQYPSASSVVYEYRTGGMSGTIVKTVTVTYTDASQANILSVVVS